MTIQGEMTPIRLIDALAFAQAKDNEFNDCSDYQWKFLCMGQHPG